VTSPTTGRIKSRGRIASLLEVGTGFHPELTGRENIYLNGAILGMTKAEISSKIDEIIDFSGCELYIDTPVKRYSSGMTVRLAFAVAAHLEPDILVIDEVLAVGDAEFQKKAIGKMQEISKGEGRTVLFVSHNMAAVKSLCTRAIVLRHGEMVFEGGTDEAVYYYLKQNSGGDGINKRIFKKEEFKDSPIVQINEISVFSKNKSLEEPILQSDFIIICTKLIKKTKERIGLVLRFKDDQGNYLFVCANEDESYGTMTGLLTYQMGIPENFFNEGTFFVDLMISYNKKKHFLENDVIQFTIVQEAKKLGDWMGKTKGPLKPKFEWELS
jgi:homopolymeric O-antigen transport system ATP-binding protein